MLDILKTILLGIVEGITEWLPISSTGHLIIMNEFIKLDMSDAFMEMFNVVIQLGAIMAVVMIYFDKLNPFSPKKTEKQKMWTWNLWFKVAVGSVPAAVVGLILNDWIEEKFNNYIVVAIMLIVYGVIFIVIENRNKYMEPKVTKLSQIPFSLAFMIGIFQMLAMIPGTSRSGATIVGAMLLGASRYVAAEYTFFLAIPVMFGASALKILKFGFHYTGMEIVVLLVGSIVSFLVSVFAIKFLMGYIKKNDFKVFGYYRIVLGILVLVCGFVGVIG